MEESISRLAGSYHGVAPGPAAADRRRPRRRPAGRRAHDALRRAPVLAGGRRGRLSMRHGLYVAPFGELSDVRALAAVAAQAEASGWDGFFVWDHVMTFDGLEVADPWIALTAVALATERLRLGAMVTPLARRRPWDVARQVAVLDRLSGRSHGLRRRPRRRQPARADRLRRGARPARPRGPARRGPRARGRPVARRARDARRRRLRARRRRGAPDAAAAAAPAGVAGLRVAQPPPARARGPLRRRLPGQPRASR